MIVDVDKFKEFEVNGSYYTITDSSVSRFFQHSENGVCIISACRGGVPIGKKLSEFTEEQKERYEKNLKRTEELKADLKNLGYGYISSVGGYPIESEKEEGEYYDADEFSFIVPRKKDVSENKFVEDLKTLGTKYNQDTILFSGIKMVNNGKPTYVDPKKKTLETEMEFDKLQSYRKNQFDPKARPFYTKFQKYPEASFVFANDSRKGQKVFAIHTPHGMFGHHICALKGEILINPIHKGE